LGAGGAEREGGVVKRLQALLARIQYKPNWSFEARAFDDHITSLVLEHLEPDATRQQAGRIRIVFVRSEMNLVLESMPDDILLRWVQQAVREAEEHEFQEFFWLDGKVLDDPHS
jgi:hypothetical protein